MTDRRGSCLRQFTRRGFNLQVTPMQLQQWTSEQLRLLTAPQSPPRCLRCLDPTALFRCLTKPAESQVLTTSLGLGS